MQDAFLGLFRGWRQVRDPAKATSIGAAAKASGQPSPRPSSLASSGKLRTGKPAETLSWIDLATGSIARLPVSFPFGTVLGL